MRYSLIDSRDKTILPFGWRKKAHAEHWIQEHIELHGGLDWRVGGLFKVKGTRVTLEVVHTKTLGPVEWFNVKPEEYDYETKIKE